jgi:3',5'-cyclic AMP phosphodiesterase CpdA
MRRHRYLLSIACMTTLTLASACAHVAPQSKRADAITFGVIGDQTLSSDLQASYGVLAKGVAELARQNVRVVLHTGDLLESTASPAEIRAQFMQGTAILDRLPVPWYMTAGDHDVNPPVFQQDSSDRSRERLFQQLYGARVPAVLEHPYYSFDAGPYHFIALYSHQALDADPRFGNIFLAQLYDDQYAFLKQDLERARTSRAIVVFIHQALWYHAGGWQRVHELLRRYPVALVISGHHHYDQDYGVTDGIRYITVGATGGNTKTGSRNAGDVQHVTVVALVDNKVTDVKLISVSDAFPLALTPRVDMDRVQALDVQLGNLFDFGQRNPAFLKSGQLVRSCAESTPATLAISQLGAPVDLPVDLKLSFSTSPAGLVDLSGAAFSAACPGPISPTQCVLPRTARTVFSNYSSVQIEGDPCVAAACAAPSQPLWTSGLMATGSGPAPGTVLRLHIRTTFQGTSGPLYLEKDVATTVQACP